MDASFSFQIDRRHGLIRITMSGLFTRADVDRFIAERAEAHRALGWPPNAHMTLNDVRAMKIQPQDVVTGFREMLADPAYRSRRLAFVAAPTLARSQLMRALAGRPDTRCFDDFAEAEAWLIAADPEQIPLRRAG